jgi:hypothetical protein
MTDRAAKRLRRISSASNDFEGVDEGTSYLSRYVADSELAAPIPDRQGRRDGRTSPRQQAIYACMPAINPIAPPLHSTPCHKFPIPAHIAATGSRLTRYPFSVSNLIVPHVCNTTCTIPDETLQLCLRAGACDRAQL